MYHILMEKIALTLENISSTSTIIEAIKYYTLSNENYEFEIFYKKTNISNLSDKKNEKIKFINDDSITLTSLINSKKYAFILSFNDDASYGDTILKDYELSIFSGYMVETKNKFSLLLGINDELLNYKFEALKTLVLNFKNKRENFKLGYVDNKDHYKENYIYALSKIGSYAGQYEIKEMLKSDLDIILINDYALDIIVDCFSSLDINRKERTGISSYFGKMFTNFPKDQKLNLTETFYKTKIFIGLPTTTIFIDKNIELTNLIYLLKTLTNYKNLSL